ncbi:unnamed protein product [Cylicocyclus nassatus]|uniref:Three prime repair exonuclease 1 n=1 Tax=Cylicocyclus nassatus TaxID=53992 RepID=A0AA36GES6_CYLNA|nr:unnamed protein product [Cylicocyclus nassatus]
MADSDDSFFDEIESDVEHEGDETQAIFEDEVELEPSDQESPFIAQLPPTPPPQPAAAVVIEAQPPMLPTTPKKMAEFANKMGMVVERAVVNVQEVSEEKPSTSVTKRSAKLTLTLSPSKTIKKKKLGSGEAVKTFVFMDFETTGRIRGDMDGTRRHVNSRLRDPHDFSSALSALIAETQRSEYPRITEMSFISVPREMFIRGQEKMKEMCDSGDSGLRVRLAANVHTRQLNPQLNENQWKAYEAARIEGKSCLNHARRDLVLKQTFAEEWLGVRAFLESCPKPACLVAHNGIYFDYRILYGELERCGFIEKDMGIPEDVVFIDSWLAIREIEEAQREEIQHTTKLVDWKMLSDQVTLSRVPGCEDIPAAVDEDKVPVQDIPEDMNVTLITAPQLPNDPRTPTRPPPTHQSRSEPPKLSSRRRLFDKELPHNDHPLLFMNAEEWSPAKIRRIRPEFFRRQLDGRWDFNRTVAQEKTKNKLTIIYETILKSVYDAHYAQDDTEALLQVCLAYGKEFLDYADNKAADFPF